MPTSGGAQPTHPDTGLGLPVQLPRRASAYDVYAMPGASGLNAMAIAAAQQRASMSAQGAFTSHLYRADGTRVPFVTQNCRNCPFRPALKPSERACVFHFHVSDIRAGRHSPEILRLPEHVARSKRGHTEPT